MDLTLKMIYQNRNKNLELNRQDFVKLAGFTSGLVALFLVLEPRPAVASLESCNQVTTYVNEYLEEASELSNRVRQISATFDLGLPRDFADRVLGKPIRRASEILSQAEWTMPSCMLYINMNRRSSSCSSAVITKFSAIGLVRRQLFDPIDDVLKGNDDKERLVQIKNFNARLREISDEANQLQRRAEQLMSSCNGE
jgi:hypothetical protein